MSEWIEKRLGEMIYINPSSLSSNHAGIIQYIDISSVERGKLLGYTEYDFSEAPGRAKRIIKNGDTIISTVRPNLRAYWYVQNCPNNAIASTGFAVIRVKGNNNGKFIYTRLQKTKKPSRERKLMVIEQMQYVILSASKIMFFLIRLKNGDINDMQHKKNFPALFCHCKTAISSTAR